jgi:hypothetical protein
MDAVSLIVSRSTAELTGIPQNWTPGIAPAKPPFLWNAPAGTMDAVGRLCLGPY